MKCQFFITILFFNISFSQDQSLSPHADFYKKGLEAYDDNDYIGAHYFFTKGIEVSPPDYDGLGLLHLLQMVSSHKKEDYLGVLRESKETLNVLMKIREDIGYGDDVNEERLKEWYEDIASMYIFKAQAIRDLEYNNLDYDKSEHCTKCDNIIQAVYYNRNLMKKLSEGNCTQDDLDNWGKICRN